ncbi:unnamed protein product [Polarella glacialis]|uniref:PLOD1-3-like GT domain-containing protein n=1 Tax=Polarella glacialis TaxID=89957 RepID=A0A813D9T8_POLGL|nr:unnamed protein product [Polarella glacialis]
MPWAARGRSAGVSALLLATFGLASAGSEDHERLNLVTYMNEVSDLFGFLQVSAEEHSLNPVIIGYGQTAWWPDGLGVKINALRKFVFGDLGLNEIVLFVDAFDVLIFGDREQIVRDFEALEEKEQRSIFFNAEQYCFPPGFEKEYPETPHRWRYLNSGIIIGRVSALREMLPDPVDDIIPGSDQAWYHRYYAAHHDKVGLDTNCAVICTANGANGPEDGVELHGRRLFNVDTGTYPSVLHLPGPGHWPAFKNGVLSTRIVEIFGELYPAEYRKLFDVYEFSLRLGGVLNNKHGLRSDQKRAYQKLMRFINCWKCRFLGSSDSLCASFYSLTSGGSFSGAWPWLAQP